MAKPSTKNSKPNIAPQYNTISPAINNKEPKIFKNRVAFFCIFYLVYI